MDFLLENYELNVTQACHAVSLQRCVYYYKPKITPQVREQRDMSIADKLRELSQKHNKRGFGVIFGLMRDQGILVNHKRAYRIYSELGLHLRRKRYKQRVPDRIKE